MHTTVSLLERTARLRSDVLDLLEAASDERSETNGSAPLVSHLQQIANDLGAAERMLLREQYRLPSAQPTVRQGAPSPLPRSA